MKDEKLSCQDCGSTGPSVELRWPGYGQSLFPRCEPCGERRLERERGNIARNFQTGPIWGDGETPDVDNFDPMDAGESFYEEDY